MLQTNRHLLCFFSQNDKENRKNHVVIDFLNTGFGQPSALYSVHKGCYGKRRHPALTGIYDNVSLREDLHHAPGTNQGLLAFYIRIKLRALAKPVLLSKHHKGILQPTSQYTVISPF